MSQSRWTAILNYEREFAGGQLVVCHAARRLIYPDGTEKVAPTMGESDGRVAPAGAAVAARILLGTPLEGGNGGCPTCSQMARLSTYRALGGFDPAFRRSEDTEFNVRLAKAGGHFVGVRRPLVTQRMTKTSEKSLEDELRYTKAILEKHRDVLDRHGDGGFAFRWLDLKQTWLQGHRAAFILGLMTLMLRYPRRTVMRLLWATPNIGLNRAFARFHSSVE